MPGQAERDNAEYSIGRSLLHSLLLLTAMVIPFFLVDPVTAAFGSAAVGAVYFTGMAIVSTRRSRSARRPGWRAIFAVIVYQFSVPAIVQGAMFTLWVGWIAFAYEWGELLPAVYALVVLVTALTIVAPFLFIALAPVIARKGGGTALRFIQGVREQGFARFHLSWIGSIAISQGLICILVFIAFLAAIHELELARRGAEVVTFWDLSAVFPILPLALVTGAVMLALSRYAFDGARKVDSLFRAYADGVGTPSGMSGRSRSVLALLIAGGWAATLFVVVYPMHLGLVAALGSVNGIAPLTGTVEAIETWVSEQREAGTPAAEIAAELNRIGTWSADDPSGGLATIVEDSETVFSESCSVRTAAGVAEPPGLAAAGTLPAEQAASDLKYCVAVSCPSPVTWDAPPALLLWSSHGSQATYWRETMFIDVFAEGRAAAPGGYCTADGELADSYQG